MEDHLLALQERYNVSIEELRGDIIANKQMMGYGVLVDNIIVQGVPAWLVTHCEMEGGMLAGKFLAMTAIELDAEPNVCTLLSRVLHTPGVCLTAVLTPEKNLCLRIHVPFDEVLQPVTENFITWYVDSRLPNIICWPEPGPFNLNEASTSVNIGMGRPLQSMKVNLTDIQRSTITWLVDRLHGRGTFNALFHCFTSVRGVNVYYAPELQCVSNNLNMWRPQAVMLADPMAGKDTAVLVYLKYYHQWQFGCILIVCPSVSTAQQWRVKCLSEEVKAVILTYGDIQDPEFVWPKTSTLILDNATAYVDVIETYVPKWDLHTHVIMLAPAPPVFRKAWRLLGHRLGHGKVWRQARTGDYTSELWSMAVLTHEDVPRAVPWIQVHLDLLQPHLLQSWKRENLAFLEQYSTTDDLPVSLRLAVVRFQKGLLGYVDAPEVHYVHEPHGDHACSICLEPLALLPVTTACRHTFCALCICEWRARSETCPLCRGELDPLQICKAYTDPVLKRRMPFVQKQLYVREQILAASKVIVLSRYVDVLVSMSRNWHAHPVYYGTADVSHFDQDGRGVWFLHWDMLNDLPDLKAIVDLVLILEHTAHTALLDRLFTFAPVKPNIKMVQLKCPGDMLDPAKASGLALISTFQNI